MFERPHHQAIAAVLSAMNTDLLRESQCYFGGGTAIALLLDEYRESKDVDFLCASQAGYRRLRESVTKYDGLGELFPSGMDIEREVRKDQYGIRAVLNVADIRIKFEIIREARIALSGEDIPGFPVPSLCRTDMYAEKLLANADRWGDTAVMSRDVIDLLMMELRWGEIPWESWKKARDAYGESVDIALGKAKDLLRNNRAYLRDCLGKMGISTDTGTKIHRALGIGNNCAPG